jgi:4,5-dihydroxyphthalate decarboxylase
MPLGEFMSKLPISFACGLYDRMVPLYTKEVEADGIDLNFLAIDSPREIFDRMSGAQEFDASEMSSSEFVARFAAGDCPFVALPVFPFRVFRHGHIAIDRRTIAAPKDLAGKRIGVPLYGMTAAIFIRGLLQHDFGVDLAQVRWIEGALNEAKPHGNPTRLKLAKPVAIEANTSAKSLSDLIAAGEISATIAPGLPKSAKADPNVGRLFPDYREREKDYYRRTRIFPIMHLGVVRRDIYERTPFVATSLYRAFCEAKDLALQKMRTGGTLRYMLPWMAAEIEEIDEVFGGDPWPYGLEPNRATLAALVQFMAEQGLIAKPVPIDDLFVPTFGLG